VRGNIVADKIGIGICTYNRANLLKFMITNVLKFAPKKAKIVIADDGSTDNTANVVKEFKKITYISGPNEGQIRNKNRLLRKLSDCDHIFIVEDDLLFKHGNWAQLFIAANKASSIQHFTFSPPGLYGKCLAESKFGNIIIRHPEFDGGAFAYYSKEVLEKCGGYCPEFRGYGWGHCEYSERIWRSGLAGKYKNNFLGGTRVHMKLIRTEPVVPVTEREVDQLRNHKIWDRSIAESWVKCPL